ncbi:MAG: YchJ family protein [Desulfobacteraceae bacterium]|nr:YchJ family protein [Desulfobacteraceae bacterium]
MQKNNCYCQSNKPFQSCCKPFLSGASKPGTPEQLMRSRFSAFCTKNIDYLIATHHPSKRQTNERGTLLQTIKDTQWLGLKIITAQKPNTDQGHVEFAAFYKAGDIGQLHEKSRFILEKHQWYYLDGEILEPVKIRRNEPCWCGSLKKFKKCHGK